MNTVHRRICAPFVLEGVGVHGGLPARLSAAPAPWGTGLVFVRGDARIPATLAHARPIAGATVLEAGGVTVSTPEHLLAALSAAGITDAWLTLDGPEVPILDGSAAPWAAAIVGIAEGPPLAPLVVDAPFVHDGFGGRVALTPGPPSLAVEVAWDGGPSGALEIAWPAGFPEVAAARTFVLARELGAARAAGRGRGATAENTVVWPADGPPPGLRFPDEPVRHKLLDAAGDLALLGAPLHGRVRVIRGSHALHVAALQAWALRR
jgi:UDP-3-O-[3-hydroxymyristoyl] N-acetylglucosamine deacetylase